MDNGPARDKKVAQRLQELGEDVGDPFEISTVRREVRVLCYLKVSLGKQSIRFYLGLRFYR